MLKMSNGTSIDNSRVDDWQTLVNKPVISIDGQEIGIVRSIQAESLMVDNGPITPDHYLIPKSSVERVENGIIHLKDDSKFVEDRYRFE